MTATQTKTKGKCTMKKMKKQLVKLLNIHGVSGDEGNVRRYLQPILTHMMDTVEVDTYGNLLATKTIGTGEGATVLLSAHMDTVRGVLADRKVIENNGVYTSDKGALGADDRAGIAIVMEVLRRVEESTTFNGTIKVAFSREEEIGCVGASRIDSDWYADVNLAMVVDRCGNRDIVAGNYFMPFCSDNVGLFMEDVAQMADMPDWKCVEGGVSDAMTFAENGINSINLSAGYMNEHTAKEYVVFEDMKSTVRLMLQVFGVINTFAKTFGEVPAQDGENKWSGGYGGSYGYYGASSKKKEEQVIHTSSYREDAFEDMVYAEADDVFVYEMGRQIAITQGDQEILLSRDALKDLMKQLKTAL